MNQNRILLVKLYLLFFPVAFSSYLFHEFGHWVVGEILGNKMIYSLNYVWPKYGHYINYTHDLYVSIGGPAFTILLSIISLLIIEKYKVVYVYPIVLFQFVLRFFSLAFGGFTKQDEARISSILEFGTYTVGIIVLIVLFLIVLRASYKLKIDLKLNGYFFCGKRFLSAYCNRYLYNNKALTKYCIPNVLNQPCQSYKLIYLVYTKTFT